MRSRRCKTGLFRMVRHPSYSGLLLVFLAVGLWRRNWVSLAIFVVPPMLALLYRMNVEERALREAFGTEYEEYSQETKRLIPGIYCVCWCGALTRVGGCRRLSDCRECSWV